MTASNEIPHALGERLVEFVNRISHREGKVLALMSVYSVTLPQVLILKSLESSGGMPLSKIAETFRMSLSSASQMVDRLCRQRFAVRREDPGDRRQKIVRATSKAIDLLAKIHRARSEEYAAGIAHLSPRLLSDLDQVLRRIIDEQQTQERPMSGEQAGPGTVRHR
ncbi:MAG: MarR family winged helix-turn-helix transcriptional regulator [Leptospirillum sp.]